MTSDTQRREKRSNSIIICAFQCIVREVSRWCKRDIITSTSIVIKWLMRQTTGRNAGLYTESCVALWTVRSLSVNSRTLLWDCHYSYVGINEQTETGVCVQYSRAFVQFLRCHKRTTKSRPRTRIAWWIRRRTRSSRLVPIIQIRSKMETTLFLIPLPRVCRHFAPSAIATTATQSYTVAATAERYVSLSWADLSSEIRQYFATISNCTYDYIPKQRTSIPFDIFPIVFECTAWQTASYHSRSTRTAEKRLSDVFLINSNKSLNRP